MKKCSRPKFKVGDRVVDTWYPEAGTGVITEILKTRTKVYFERATFKGGWQCPLFRGAKENGILTYDRPHYRFLKHELERYNSKTRKNTLEAKKFSGNCWR